MAELRLPLNQERWNTMNLVELAYFTDNVADMVAFYRRLLGQEPMVESESAMPLRKKSKHCRYKGQWS